jgi:hypothetical protein
MAAARNQVEVMTYLIEKGADWRIRSKVWPFLSPRVCTTSYSFCVVECRLGGLRSCRPRSGAQQNPLRTCYGWVQIPQKPTRYAVQWAVPRDVLCGHSLSGALLAQAGKSSIDMARERGYPELAHTLVALRSPRNVVLL